MEREGLLSLETWERSENKYFFRIVILVRVTSTCGMLTQYIINTLKFYLISCKSEQTLHFKTDFKAGIITSRMPVYIEEPKNRFPSLHGRRGVLQSFPRSSLLHISVPFFYLMDFSLLSRFLS